MVGCLCLVLSCLNVFSVVQSDYHYISARTEFLTFSEMQQIARQHGALMSTLRVVHSSSERRRESERECECQRKRERKSARANENEPASERVSELTNERANERT